MARIAGVNIPTDKRLIIALTYIFGIGKKNSADICLSTKISESKRVKDLSDDEILRIRECIESYQVEGDLRSQISSNIKRLMDLKTNRGLRHRNNLPCRGQRTKTNARTRRVRKSTPIANKKK